MKKNLIELGGCIPDLIKNTHLTINLQGWPAAVSVVALCTGGVAIYAIKAVTSPESEDGTSGSPQQQVEA